MTSWREKVEAAINRYPGGPFLLSGLLPILTIALALAIFVVDTVTDLEIAVAVFYVAVVLLSVSFCSRRGVLLVSGVCMGLTVLSYLLTPTGDHDAGLINSAISMAAIALTTYLALKIEATQLSAQEARAQLEHISRVTTLGELAASIAHEVNQPLAAIASHGNASQRWLSADPPNLAEVKDAIEHVVEDAARAGEIIARVRALATKAAPQHERLSVNEAIQEVVDLTRGEAQRNRVSLRARLADDLSHIKGDRIQLQQVILNLILNGIDAINTAGHGTREILVVSANGDQKSVLVSVRDTGTGLSETGKPECLFDAFYTTKPDGMGMGLTISRSIIEAHGGRIWAIPNLPRGAVVQFTLPAGQEPLP